MLHHHKYFDIELNGGSKDYLIPLYSIPLLHLKVKDWDIKKKKFWDLYNKRAVDPTILKKTGRGSYDVDTDYHANFDTDNYQDISELIETQLGDELDIISSIFEANVLLENSWFERSTKGKFHSTHNHGNRGLSAVLFMKFDPKHHTPTVFLNPFDYDCPTSPHNEMPPGIREGSLIVFPASIYHYTNPCETDEERIILSFNITLIPPEQCSIAAEVEFTDNIPQEYILGTSDV